MPCGSRFPTLFFFRPPSFIFLTSFKRQDLVVARSSRFCFVDASLVVFYPRPIQTTSFSVLVGVVVVVVVIVIDDSQFLTFFSRILPLRTVVRMIIISLFFSRVIKFFLIFLLIYDLFFYSFDDRSADVGNDGHRARLVSTIMIGLPFPFYVVARPRRSGEVLPFLAG